MSFFIKLPSDSSMGYFPNNTTSKYRTYLPESVKLQGPYEVALAEISYTPESCMLTLHDTLKETESTAYFRLIELPAGYYGNIEDLLEHLNYDEDGISNVSILKSNVTPDDEIFDTESTTEAKYKFRYINRLRRVEGSVKANYMLSIPRPLAVMLVFTKNETKTTSIAQIRIATYPVDLDAGLHSLFIYSNSIESRAVGDFHVPLLIASVQGRDGETRDKEFSRPHYLPVSTNTFQSIEVNVMSEMGLPVKFERG